MANALGLQSPISAESIPGIPFSKHKQFIFGSTSKYTFNEVFGDVNIGYFRTLITKDFEHSSQISIILSKYEPGMRMTSSHLPITRYTGKTGDKNFGFLHKSSYENIDQVVIESSIGRIETSNGAHTCFITNTPEWASYRLVIGGYGVNSNSANTSVITTWGSCTLDIWYS